MDRPRGCEGVLRPDRGVSGRRPGHPRRSAPPAPRSTLAQEAGQSFVYFGHLQFWKPDDLETALQQRDILSVLSHQLVNMSKIAWRKHRFVQLSFLLAATGGALVFLAGLST
ncbi:Pycsar system effector family protein [Streptomyces chartreusis]